MNSALVVDLLIETIEAVFVTMPLNAVMANESLPMTSSFPMWFLFAGTTDITSDEVKSAVRKIMTRSAGLYRTHDGLSLGLRELDDLRDEVYKISTGTFSEAIRALEAGHMILVARIVISAAMARTESRGAHQRCYFPHTDDEHWLKHVAIRAAGGTLEIRTISLN